MRYDDTTTPSVHGVWTGVQDIVHLYRLDHLDMIIH
jgi:hypothetical protein